MCDQDNITPASRCATSLQISNVGDDDSQPFFYSVRAWSDADGIDSGAAGPSGDVLQSCFNVNLTRSTADGLNVGNNSAVGPLAGSKLQAGDAETWGIEASVDDDNTCQGESTWLIVSVSAFSNEDELPGGDGGAPGAGVTETADTGNGIDDTGYAGRPTSTPFATASATTTSGGGALISRAATSTPSAPSGATTPVNELPGVQRLPSTGSGGLLGGSSFALSAFSTAALVLLLGVILAGGGIIASLHRRR
jgi:hypothetical protein